MPDSFSGNQSGLESPAAGGAAITPHDSNELATWSRGIYVGTGGNIAVTMANGVDVTFTAVPQGVILPIRTKIVKATGTTASNLIALY